jgi:hypothetical protein
MAARAALRSQQRELTALVGAKLPQRCSFEHILPARKRMAAIAHDSPRTRNSRAIPRTRRARGDAQRTHQLPGLSVLLHVAAERQFGNDALTT